MGESPDFLPPLDGTVAKTVCWQVRDVSVSQLNPPPRVIRIGIRGKLFLAFGSVAGLTIMATIVAIVSYNNMSTTLRGITEDNIPAMSLSLRLAKSSAQIAAAAPALLGVTGIREIDHAMSALAGTQAALDDAIATIEDTADGEQTAERLRPAAAKIRRNLYKLSAMTGSRLTLRSRKIAAMADVRGKANALNIELTPLIEDANFRLFTGLRASSEDAVETNAARRRLYDQQLDIFRAMLALRAESNLAAGLLMEAANIPDLEALTPIRDRFVVATAAIQKALAVLEATPNTALLTQPVAELLRFGAGDGNIFDLRLQELEATSEAEAILATNRKLIDTLTPMVEEMIESNERAANKAADNTRQVIARGQLLLIGIASLSLVISLTIAVFYVGRMVVRRLTALSRAMSDIAKGDLTVAIPRSGHDEITEMSDAMAVFKNEMTENVRLGAELDVTRRLQQMLLPSADELGRIEGLDVAGHMQAAVEVGGDYYDILQHDGQVKIGIGDVTGHGLESGVIMVMTQAIVRALLTSGETDPVRFLSALNRTLFGNVDRMGSDKNMTLCLLDYADGNMTISGQHEEIIVVRRDGTVELVDTADLGFPIGLEQDITAFVSHTTIRLEPGDGVVLYTDGITEAANIENEQYGLPRLCEVIQEHWKKSSEEIKDAVVSALTLFIGTQEVYDDITLVVIKQK